MELAELQNMWTKHDETMNESIKLNREILKQLLREKPEKRVLWLKVQSIFKLILPWVVIGLFFIPQLKFRDEFSFYMGALLFGPFCILTYSWTIKHFLLVMKIDFTNEIITLKKQISELEKYKLKTTKLGYLISPIGMTGVFMLAGFKIHEVNLFTLTPFILIVVVFASSVYITFKYSIFDRFKKLNQEISELEELESDR